MVADLDGSVAAQYIHWYSDDSGSFKVSEILCYEEKRVYSSEMYTSSRIQNQNLAQNSHITFAPSGSSTCRNGNEHGVNLLSPKYITRTILIGSNTDWDVYSSTYLDEVLLDNGDCN